MKALVILVTVVGLGSVAATVAIGASVKEPTVVANPYEEGLRYDATRKAEAAARVAAGTAPAGAPRAPGVADPDGSAPAGPTGALELEISPRPPRAMSDLEFTVRGAPPDAAVSISLTMPGMYMGENRIRLAPAGGAHRGKGVVVRCPSGDRTWAADVEVRPRDGAPATRRFTFEVADR